MYAAGKKRRKINQEGDDLLAAKPERGSMMGDPWVQVQSNKKRVSSRNGRWAFKLLLTYRESTLSTISVPLVVPVGLT